MSCVSMWVVDVGRLMGTYLCQCVACLVGMSVSVGGWVGGYMFVSVCGWVGGFMFVSVCGLVGWYVCVSMLVVDLGQLMGTCLCQCVAWFLGTCLGIHVVGADMSSFFHIFRKFMLLQPTETWTAREQVHQSHTPTFTSPSISLKR